jgi:hypothetical protein
LKLQGNPSKSNQIQPAVKIEGSNSKIKTNQSDARYVAKQKWRRRNPAPG